MREVLIYKKFYYTFFLRQGMGILKLAWATLKYCVGGVVSAIVKWPVFERVFKCFLTTTFIQNCFL